MVYDSHIKLLLWDNFPRGQMKISETTLNCCKPNRFTSFKGTEDSGISSKKPRCKHYIEMSDDVLGLRSVLKAHQDVQNSNKMRMFKAIPHITTALLGTTIALTQPGKLAAKAAAGLGFLALTNIISHSVDSIGQKIEQHKKGENKINAKDVLKTGLKIAAGAGAVALAVAGLKNAKVSTFLKKEASQLANEINETKLGKFVEETLNPFVKKNASKLGTLSILAPYGIIAGSSFAQIKLSDSLSKDIKQKASENFAKGKFAQAQARAHFDSIDAVEV